MLSGVEKSGVEMSSQSLGLKLGVEKSALQISIGWLSVISSVIPLALIGFYLQVLIPIGKTFKC